ncbi:hypothetical protein E8K88_11855 [Lampropedia aestuarii]|uniref:Uncharacterized protein n=1 Tax=Lampropedia aestuarii TaxID=2562762 RepID=A0A4S5BJN6_9BURK|nr:hypothetical protein [Lampropedia aestuarii]THJ32389.1 hypothetical protein E8K88_11855 [Lampropedia aestuarii]
MEKELLDELRTIKMMCIANFVELQEIRRKLNIADSNDDDWYEYVNSTRDQIDALDKKLRRLFKDDLPNLWEQNIGKSPG